MAGKMCFGSTYNNAGAGHLRSSKAFCEGIEYRTGGTAVARPKADNPHQSGSDAADAWDTGWDIAQAAAGGSVTPSSAPCCAVGGTIAA